MKTASSFLACVFACVLCTMLPSRAAAQPFQGIVDVTVRPVMAKDRIPGMAVALTVNGKLYEYDYGLASLSPRRPVTRETLFELGSVSKIYTATLTSYAQATGKLQLGDPVGRYLPALARTPFGGVTLLELGTHTPGGLPLQVPDGVNDDAQLVQWLATWHAAYPPGTYRTYSNVGIGTLGLIAAKALGGDFAAQVEARIFAPLLLSHSYYTVSGAAADDYAWGYRKGKAIRMSPGELWAQAYGVKSTAADLARFLQANMDEIALDPELQSAITQTHTGYFTAAPLTQDLIWEQYTYPVSLQTLLDGNSPDMIFKAKPAQRLQPPESPRTGVWLNKTGSTNGFGAYIAFVPGKHLGIAILANENYPIEDRVRIAYRILTAIAQDTR